ncbi:hypothetical protein D3C85_1742070 [compost metagenome]
MGKPEDETAYPRKPLLDHERTVIAKRCNFPGENDDQEAEKISPRSQEKCLSG